MAEKWVEKVLAGHEKRLKEEGLNKHDFRLLHMGHDVEERNITLNSEKVDPTTSDLEPVFKTQLFCLTDEVASAAE